MRDVLTKEHKFFIGKPDRIIDGLSFPDEFNITRMIEKALAYQSNGLYTFVDADGYDFSDHSDAKTATVRMNNHKTKQRMLTISSVGNKIGALRLIVSNPFTDRVDFFYIPQKDKKLFISYESYGKHHIYVPWSHKNGYNKLNRFQVASFRELARMSDQHYPSLFDRTI